MSDEVETNILYLGQPGDAGRKRMSEILERLDDLWEKASDVDSLTVLDAREEIVKLRAEAKDAADEIEKLQTLLESVLNACDQGWKVERSVGGMTVEGQMRRSFYNRVPAWPIEEARAAWGEKK